jgi:hypothetical protein
VEFKGINTFDPDAQPHLLARFTVPTGSTTMTSEIFDAPCYDCLAGPAGTPGTSVDQPDDDTCRTEPPPSTTSTTGPSTSSSSTGPTTSTTSPGAGPSTTPTSHPLGGPGVAPGGVARPVPIQPDFTG